MRTVSKLDRLPNRIVLRLLELLAGRRQGLAPLVPGDLRRVLLMRYDRLGDLVITTPMIDALRRIAPRAEIDVLGSSANRALIEYDPRISNIWIWGGSPLARLRTIRACRARHYDAVFQLLYSRTTLPAILAGLLAPHGRTIGKSAIGHTFLFNHAVQTPEVHYKERTIALLEGLALQEPLGDFPYSIHIPDAERRHAREVLAEAGLEPGGFIMLNISAGNALRELTTEQNATLARRLAALGYRVAIISAPSAAEWAREIAAQSDAVALRFRTLVALAAAMEDSRLVVTPDTGTLHVAAAAGVPVVGMYASNGDPAGWSPSGVPFAVVQVKPGETFGMISIDEVVAAAEKMKDER